MNPEQVTAIRHGEGPVELVAQAGSGKTRVVVHRSARLVEAGTLADRIFLVTFSRDAKNEMEQRCRFLGVPGVSVQTWHAFCLRVLKEDQTRCARWDVDEKDRARILVKKAIGHEHENWKGGDVSKVRRFIGVCKANLAGPEDAFATERAAKMFARDANRAIRVYAISQSLIEGACLLTFDDMLVYVWRHFQEEVHRRAWAAKFDYVIQDEAQDANRAQCEIARALAQDHRNYMIVGDPSQSIYGFRGSSPEHLTSFEAEWGARRIAMCRNYRSGSAIVAAANAIIRPAANRLPEDMIAERDGGRFTGRVEMRSCDVLEDEAREFAEFVKSEIEGGRDAGDICCLFRTNAQSRSLEEALLKARLPYMMVGGTNFYERKEVKDLLAYLRVAAERDDSESVKRCINAPFRFLGAKFVERVMQTSERTPGWSWAQIVQTAAEQTGVQRRQVDSASDWASIIRDLQAMISDETKTAAETLDWLIRRTGYLEWLEKEEGDESIENSHAANVRELVRVAHNFHAVSELLDYVDKNVAESARQRRSRKSAQKCVLLMSIHRSKGLEWPVVWLVGANETILPHAKGDIEEERRLMYVAVTRARDHLVISHVAELATRWGVKQVDRSHFLDDVVATEPERPSGVIEAPQLGLLMGGEEVSP